MFIVGTRSMKTFRLPDLMPFVRLRSLVELAMSVLSLFGLSQIRFQVATLQEWTRRDVEFRGRFEELWSSYDFFFHSRGYTLWRRCNPRFFEQVPPNACPRTPDGFSYTVSNKPEKPWVSISTKLHAARTPDNRDVVIVLISDGARGTNAVKALEAVGRGFSTSMYRNHTLPVLDWLRQDNLVFGVFPMVGRWCDAPWFGSVGNILDFMGQIMEGVAFLHDHHVAHRDLFMSNFVNSWRLNDQMPGGNEALRQTRYYIIDFEYAVCFPPDANAATRMVVGPPVDFEIYERPAPPEMRRKSLHCPFKVDVWQLGCTFLTEFGHIEEISEIIELLRKMRAADPAERPTAEEALNSLNRFRSSVSSDVTRLRIQRPDEPLEEEEDFDYRVW